MRTHKTSLLPGNSLTPPYSVLRPQNTAIINTNYNTTSYVHRNQAKLAPFRRPFTNAHQMYWPPPSHLNPLYYKGRGSSARPGDPLYLARYHD